MKLDGEVLDVGGGEAQGLDLAELPVQRLGGDQLPQAGEGRVDALGAVPLPHVGDHARLLSRVLRRAGVRSWCWLVFSPRLPHADCVPPSPQSPLPPPPRLWLRCRHPLHQPSYWLFRRFTIRAALYSASYFDFDPSTNPDMHVSIISNFLGGQK